MSDSEKTIDPQAYNAPPAVMFGLFAAVLGGLHHQRAIDGQALAHYLVEHMAGLSEVERRSLYGKTMEQLVHFLETNAHPFKDAKG